MRIVYYACLATTSIFHTALASEPDMQALAVEFANCTAIYTMGAVIADASEEGATKHRLLNLGNDALETSKFIASSFVPDRAEEFVDHAVQMEMLRMESAIRAGNATYWVDSYHNCLEYKEAQGELLREIRKSTQ